MAYAGFRPRCAAAVIDLLLALVCFGVASWSQHFLGAADGAHGQAVLRQAPSAYATLAVVVVAVLWCWIVPRATPGKFLMGCQVVDARSARRLRLHQALLRLLGYALAALPLGLGLVWLIWDRRKQGWHDKLAGSVVVVEDESRLTLAQLAERLG